MLHEPNLLKSVGGSSPAKEKKKPKVNIDIKPNQSEVDTADEYQKHHSQSDFKFG